MKLTVKNISDAFKVLEKGEKKFDTTIFYFTVEISFKSWVKSLSLLQNSNFNCCRPALWYVIH